MKRFVLIAAALGMVFVLAWVAVSWTIFSTDQQREAQTQQLLALGKKLAPELEKMSTFSADPLKDACKGKLAPGGPRTLALLSLPLEKPLRPALDKRRVDGMLAAWSGTSIHEDLVDPPAPGPSFLRTMERNAEFYEWPRYVEDRAAREEETAQLKYLAVALFGDLSPASIPFLREDGTFDAGRAEYRVKVVKFPSGELVCEGVGRGRMVQKVIGHGKARDSFDAKSAARSDLERKLEEKWVSATLGSPLEDVCEAGGEKLCFHAKLMTDGPDW